MHDTSYCVTDNGAVVMNRPHRFSLTVALAGQRVGMREVADGLWLVSFMDLQLGHYDCATKKFKASDELVTEEQAA
jgi:hypothetical protein